MRKFANKLCLIFILFFTTALFPYNTEHLAIINDTSNKDLRNLDLTGAGALIRRKNFVKVNLSGTKLYDCCLDGASFKGAMMEGTSLSGSHICGTNFRRAKLINVELLRVVCGNMYGKVTSFRRAVLVSTSVSGFNLSQVSFKNSIMRGSALVDLGDLNMPVRSRSNSYSHPFVDHSDECCVCLEGYEEDDEEIMILPCGHRFHKICGMWWLRERPVCPLCKCLVCEYRTEPFKK